MSHEQQLVIVLMIIKALTWYSLISNLSRTSAVDQLESAPLFTAELIQSFFTELHLSAHEQAHEQFPPEDKMCPIPARETSHPVLQR